MYSYAYSTTISLKLKRVLQLDQLNESKKVKYMRKNVITFQYINSQVYIQLKPSQFCLFIHEYLCNM
ncbi:unnamed protein product [Acanthoscelides obtectus]|uniref:Uncharacterized protein n=1 Tax=Acanthoscelides obtectus TaxID=200917 RepID=A0A9P0KCY9_ACAOB|nr:unnamed protein product [Acanthoscelides obtectus]CAK1645751.1 hypothetical protein AOBTE_LOCUS14242 [Acanthoscelides obtectus]